MELSVYNRHWKQDFRYGISFQRKYFSELVDLLDNRLILKLFGLRRVGKTTLMRQLIDHLIVANIPREHILYYSFDDFGDPEEIFETYFRLTGVGHEMKIYVFFDEIQKVADWQSKIKMYYDQFPNIKFILSGSSSLELTRKESLAGRMIERRIQPLFFDEYLAYRGHSAYLEKSYAYRAEIISEFERYVSRQFIDIIDASDDAAREYTLSLKNKIIKEDIVSFFRIEYPHLLDKIFRVIAAKPGMLLEYKHLANDLDVDQRTLEKYVYYLEEAFLIRRLYNYSPNLIKSERKLKKIYLSATSFATGGDMGEIFENYLVNAHNFEYFYRSGAQEVDFVQIDESWSARPIEAKYRSKIQSSDLKHLRQFATKFHASAPLVVSKDVTQDVDDIAIRSFYDPEVFGRTNGREVKIGK